MSTLELEIKAELRSILQYWQQCVVNPKGGFYGRVNAYNQPDESAPVGSVMIARILWSFSAASTATGHQSYLPYAQRAFEVLTRQMIDPVYGGLFWSIDAAGAPHDTTKKIYAQAFGIYALSEYYRATKEKAALALAENLYELIEKYSYDTDKGGYFDAFQRNWTPLADQRLSAKDENAAKTMNTHLHLLEAFANLYEVHPSLMRRDRIVEILDLFSIFIIDPETFHLHLFFDDDWIVIPSVVSFGHDIEAGWLLQQCAASIHDEYRVTHFSKMAVSITRAAMEGLDQDGGLWYEFDPSGKQWVREKHWWPQAEALIGLLNAYEISADPVIAKAFFDNWKFIKKYLMAPAPGEWYWGIDARHQPMEGQDKAGIWKCPYHNTRSCIELLQRLPKIRFSR